MLAPALPAAFAPPPPFPAIVRRAAVDPAFVAPGVARADYRIVTADGPLAIHVVAVDPREPTVRLGAVVAHDRLVSRGETVSSMARRTGAVAGINADYFDIGATYQPLNVVVRDGVLLRSPSARAALWVDRAGRVAMGTMTFSGALRWDGATLPLAGLDVWPPNRGASLLLPVLGTPPAAEGVSTIPLAGGARLALPPGSAEPAPPPGSAVAADLTLVPPLAGIRTAVGGGPLLVRDGAPYDDPHAPAPEETLRRFPLAGAAVRADGTLALVVVDGRRPERSIGLTRPQFGALLRAFGARDGMAFDSGGSSTLVARVLGDPRASVRNDPSDGVERPVADGLFVYSDAPRGRPDRLAFRPPVVRALRGARVAVAAFRVDAAGHAFGKAPGFVVTARPGLRAAVPVTVVTRLAALHVEPSHPNPDPGAALRLRAIGEDARGDEIAVDGAVRWSASGATIASDGTLRAGARDALVVARAGGVATRVAIPVGRHDVAQTVFADPAAWRFASAPAGAPGAVAVAGGTLRLDYDLRGTTRAAYAATTLALPGEPVALALEVDGDGSGVPLRASFVNRYGEPVALTLAARVDWSGPRRLRVRIPGELNPPVVLRALYVVPSLGGPPVRSAGMLRFRGLVLTEPGTP